MITSNVQEEVTTTTTDSPQQTVKTTTQEVEPSAKGDTPQKVYNKKKNIIRFNQIIWYILGVIEVLLLFRIVLKILGANPNIGFTSFIYTLTAPLALPFSGILGTTVAGASIIEWSTVVAAIVYLCAAWGLIKLLELFFPITPEDVRAE